MSLSVPAPWTLRVGPRVLGGGNQGGVEAGVAARAGAESAVRDWNVAAAAVRVDKGIELARGSGPDC